MVRIQVIINTVCPGLVSTDIARSITKKSTLMRLVVPVYLGVLGKSANYGARFYVSAALEPKANHVRVDGAQKTMIHYLNVEKTGQKYSVSFLR